MKESIFSTLAKTTGIGLLSGLVGGIWLVYAIHQRVEERILALGAENMMQAPSMRCAAGDASFALFILSLPAGALFGLLLGGFFLVLKIARRRFD